MWECTVSGGGTEHRGCEDGADTGPALVGDRAAGELFLAQQPRLLLQVQDIPSGEPQTTQRPSLSYKKGRQGIGRQSFHDPASTFKN